MLLPPGDGVVVLNERPTVKGDGLRLSGRLLVDGCGGEKEGGSSKDEIMAIDEEHASVIRAKGRGG